MNVIVDYFSSVPDFHRVVLLALCLLFFGNIELFSASKASHSKSKHILVNALFMLPAAPVQLFMGFLIVTVIQFTNIHHIGIIYALNLNQNGLVAFLVSFVLLDLFEYCYHLCMHSVKRLWMIHAVHHSDTELTVSTTLREHPMETFVRLLFLVIWVFIIGVSFWALLFRQFIQIVSNVFAHSNFRLSEKADRIVSLIFVTPNLHQVHHHFKLPNTDSNYGDVLSLWDRLFGTYRTARPEHLQFGLDTFPERTETSNFLKLLRIPLGKYRSINKNAEL